MKKISLTQEQVATVSDEDYDELSKHKWYALWVNHRYYVAVRRDGDTIAMMHREIMNAPNGVDVDHIDGDRLNNTRENLRLATRSQNCANVSKRRYRDGTASMYKGVTLSKSYSRKCWRARVSCGYKRVHVGYFETEEEAARAYDAKAKELFGEFALLNFPGR